MIWPNKEPIAIQVVDANPELRWFCPNCKRSLWLPSTSRIVCPLCYTLMFADKHLDTKKESECFVSFNKG